MPAQGNAFRARIAADIAHPFDPFREIRSIRVFREPVTRM